MKKTKGLSTVVTSLILILLVLVAIGLIWLVIRNVVEEGSGQIDVGTRCLDIDVRATAVTCTNDNPDNCVVTLTRRSGGDDIGGVAIVFEDDAGETTTSPIDVAGNIEALTNDDTSSVNSGLDAPTMVKVTPYINDEQGEPQYCSTTEFSF